MNSRCLKSLVCLFLVIFSGCSIFSIERKPYTLAADFVMDEGSPVYKICGANLFFYNNSEKAVKEMEVVFYLFDSEGEPASECPGRVTFVIEKDVGPDEEAQLCLSLDSFMTLIPKSLLEIDYLYVSKILYADGSIWQDPFGFTAFM